MIKCSPTLEPAKIHFWDKQISTKWQILIIAGIVIILISAFFLSAYIHGQKTLKAQGYDSPEDVIIGYFDAIDSNDGFNLQRCYDLYSVTGRSAYKQQSEIAKAEHKIIAADTANAEIETHAYDNMDDIIRNTKNSNISASNVSQVVINVDKTVDDITYTQKCLYRFITYEFNSKWYIYAQQNTMSMTTSAMDKDGNNIPIAESGIDMTDTVKVGDNTVGYISIGSDWIETDGSESAYAEKVYMNPDGSAEISIAMIETDLNVKGFAQNLYDVFSESDKLSESLTMSDITIGGCDGTIIVCSDNITKQLFSAWVFDDNTNDNYIRYITLECTAENTAMTNYVNTFRFE